MLGRKVQFGFLNLKKIAFCGRVDVFGLERCEHVEKIACNQMIEPEGEIAC